MMINVGSFVSIFTTPLMRVYLGYWIAFGVPAILLIISLIIFWSGRNSYNMVPVTKPNVFVTTCKVLAFGIIQKFRNCSFQNSKKGHWLDCAEPLYGAEIVQDVKALLRIMVIFV
jgi:solute carrier family 15 oligopeptide transporter 1